MSRYPSTDVGEEGTADLLTAMIDDIYVKVSSESRTSTTTVSNDTELANIPLGIGTFAIHVGWYTVGETGGGSDLRTRWAYTGTVSASTPTRSVEGPVSSSTTAANAITTTVATRVNYSTENVYGLGGTIAFIIHEESYVFAVTTAGNFSIQWAQGTSSGTATQVLAGSYVRIKQIA